MPSEGGGAEHSWALQADLRSLLISRMVSEPTVSHVQQFDFQKQIFGFYINQKLFFKNLNMIMKLLMVHKQFELKSLLLLRFRLILFF